METRRIDPLSIEEADAFANLLGDGGSYRFTRQMTLDDIIAYGVQSGFITMAQAVVLGALSNKWEKLRKLRYYLNTNK